jgi:hypothetical protein
MSRFIGQNLNERQIAALQAVANGCGGAQFASIETILRIPDNHRDCSAIEGIELDDLNVLLNELEAEYLIQRKEIKGKPHAGLTEDGERCNLISVY